MNRVTYNKLKEWLEDWNTSNPEAEVKLSCYSDYYHILDGKTHTIIVCEHTPGRCWEVFGVWKKGYWKGRDTVKEEGDI